MKCLFGIFLFASFPFAHADYYSMQREFQSQQAVIGATEDAKMVEDFRAKQRAWVESMGSTHQGVTITDQQVEGTHGYIYVARIQYTTADGYECITEFTGIGECYYRDSSGKVHPVFMGKNGKITR